MSIYKHFIDTLFVSICDSTSLEALPTSPSSSSSSPAAWLLSIHGYRVIQIVPTGQHTLHRLTQPSGASLHHACCSSSPAWLRCSGRSRRQWRSRSPSDREASKEGSSLSVRTCANVLWREGNCMCEAVQNASNSARSCSYHSLPVPSVTVSSEVPASLIA